MVSLAAPMMGGRVGVHLRRQASVDGRWGDRDARAAQEEVARSDARRLLRRLAAWAARLTRFEAASELMRLNGDPRCAVPVRPTIAAVLKWARQASMRTEGLVDVTLLDQRLAAEAGTTGWEAPRPMADRGWTLASLMHGALVRRPAGLGFDLDGVAKGWLADRALALTTGYPSALIDADGDIAGRLATGESWAVSVADPRAPGAVLAILELTASAAETETRFGLATSGTSIHRWGQPVEGRHHLIDPRTNRPAVTDVVQATVLGRSARDAEALAKAAVILGSAAGVSGLERWGADGAILLTDRGEVLVPRLGER